MIYLLISATGQYEDYIEDIHCYFTDKDKAYEVYRNLRDFDTYITSKFKGSKDCYYHIDDFRRRCYRKIGIYVWINCGLKWHIKEVKEYIKAS